MRKTLSYLLKIAVVVCAFTGVVFSFIYARRDGYSHWLRRSMYFTAQSNLWVGFTFLALLLLPLYRGKKKAVLERRLYLFKYVFTVSITTTGLIFCLLLGPFADESYHPWSSSSLLTHLFTPLLCIADFFVDTKNVPLTARQSLFALLPPLFYFTLAGVLGFFQFDFGRGVSYPYFFLNFRSPAGVFGFSRVFPFFIGSAYWFLLFGALTYFIGRAYARYTRR